MKSLKCKLKEEMFNEIQETNLQLLCFIRNGTRLFAMRNDAKCHFSIYAGAAFPEKRRVNENLIFHEIV
jgi:hypothetical protein